ncbi:TPA: ORF6N domain-containing protein [Salmonella bongori]
MTNHSPVENLPVVTYNTLPVVTTDMLAQVYGTETIRIQQNHKRNDDRFIEGKHFFKLEGTKLKAFKNRLSLSESVGKRARSLVLWTERGAARHAKMLETDQAWEVFEKLEDCYFSQKQQTPTRQVSPTIDMMNIDLLIQIRDGNVKDIRQVGSDMFVGKVDQILSGLRESGWIVIKRELLAEKLATW